MWYSVQAWHRCGSGGCEWVEEGVVGKASEDREEVVVAVEDERRRQRRCWWSEELVMKAVRTAVVATVVWRHWRAAGGGGGRLWTAQGWCGREGRERARPRVDAQVSTSIVR